jgi:hypothetical protein
VHHGQGEGVSESDQLRHVATEMNGRGAGKQKTDGYDNQRRQVACQRSVSPHVHEGLTVGNAAANLNDCSGSTAESRRGENPRKG